VTRSSTDTGSDRTASAGLERIISWRRLLLSLGLGAAGGVVVALVGGLELSVLAGWVFAAGVLLFWSWRVSWPLDDRGTERIAEAEGRTRATDSAVLVAAVASLGAVVVALIRSSSHDALATAAVVLGLVAVVLSWGLVNTVFAFKYARLFYAGGDGGIDFKQEERPAYCDFAYLAFTVGMAFAPPETDIIDRSIRKVALGHALLSYLFGTVVFAVAVNLVTNLGQS
jgi:uncharacterized membrane protein